MKEGQSGYTGIGILSIVLGSIILLIFSITLTEYVTLLSRGIETMSKITDLYTQISSTSNTPDFYIQISYFAPDPEETTQNPLHPGKMFFGHEMVTSKFWKTHQVGDEVPIIYLPENPAVRILKVGKPKAEFSGQIIALVFSLIVIGTGIYFIIANRKQKG